MPYRTILSHFVSIDESASVLEAAMTLATQQDAHLIGLYVIPQYRINLLTGYDASPEVLESFQQRHLAAAREIERQFEHQRQQNGLSAEWRVIESPTADIAPIVCGQSRMADVVLAGYGDDIAEGWMHETVMDHLLMQSGRPVIRIPAESKNGSLCQNVLIAWNGSREAASAIFGALPILEQAKQVFLHSVDPPKTGKSSSACSTSDMAATLARHDVKLDVSESASGGLSLGEALLYQAESAGCDLLVLGAYGHWRFREYVLSGVTHHVLRNAKIPSLMAH